MNELEWFWHSVWGLKKIPVSIINSQSAGVDTKDLIGFEIQGH